ncbi:hypothetical protein LCGC14_1197370, partial [marine sediment metagenome]
SLEIRTGNSVIRIRDTGDTATATTSFVEFGGTTAAAFSRTGYIGDSQVANTDIILQAEQSDLRLGDSTSESVLTLSGGDVIATGTIIATVGFDIVGAADIDYGSADVTDHTFLSDGTGTGEFVLKAGAIDSTEILDGTVTEVDLNVTNAPGAGEDNYVLTYNHAGTNMTWAVDAGGGNDVYVEEGDAARVDSSGADLYIDFDDTDFGVGVVGNEGNITITDDGHAHTGTSLSGIDWDDIDNAMTMDAPTTIAMANNSLTMNFTTPSDGLTLNSTGAFTNHLLHLHQSAGNPGAGTALAHLSYVDVDIIPIFADHVGVQASAIIQKYQLNKSNNDTSDNDELYDSWYFDQDGTVSAQGEIEFIRTTYVATDTSEDTEDAQIEWDLMSNGTLTERMVLNNAGQLQTDGGLTTAGTVEGATITEGGVAVINATQGGTWTGVHDFGGADLEMPQASPAVPGVDGGIELDFTDGKVVIQHGSAHAELGASTDVVVGTLIKSWSGTIWTPDGVNDVITIKAINSIEFPHGVVITAIYLGVSEDSNYTLTFQNFDDFDTINAGNPTIDAVAYTADTTGEIIDSTPTYATIAAGQIIMMNIPVTNVDWIHFEIYYFEPAA